MYTKKVDTILVFIIQIIFVILFAFFTTYSENYEQDAYPMFQDVHVMIFIGFGFLMTFLRRYGYSAVGFNFLLGALIIQWALLCQGFYQLDMDHKKIEIGIANLYEADIAAATVLISMGAVLGRTSYIQLLIMGIIEIVAFSANSYIGLTLFKAVDAGGSMFVHTFGAYFGLALSFIIEIKKKKTEVENTLEESRYTSDIFAMIGTIFLWLFWPSFNAVELKGESQQRAIINTYLSLASCCVTTFVISSAFNENHKFDMVHVQNSTLAGGVAVGTSANLMLHPYGAIIIGIISGILSVIGYVKLTPWLSTKGIRDTCGVHNLHGMPGVLAGIIGTIMAGIASESIYFESLYDIYPARANSNNTGTSEHIFSRSAFDRTPGQQAIYQILALIVTLAMAIVSGLITGSILRISKLKSVTPDHERRHGETYYNDATSWILPEHSNSTKKGSAMISNYDNPSFEPSEKNGTSTDAVN